MTKTEIQKMASIIIECFLLNNVAVKFTEFDESNMFDFMKFSIENYGENGLSSRICDGGINNYTAQEISRRVGISNITIAYSYDQNKHIVTAKIPKNEREILDFESYYDAWKNYVFGSLKKGELKTYLTENIVAVTGVDENNNLITFKLSQTNPHALIAGGTGSGKTEQIKCIIESIVNTYPIDQVQLALVDPKMTSFRSYKGTSHLYDNVASGFNESVLLIKKLIKEMDARYTLFEQNDVDNIIELNNLEKFENLPKIVVVVDELAALVYQDKKIILDIQTLLVKARAAGIHIILTAQRPDSGVLNQAIKTNIQTRISFKMMTSHDSRQILGTGGAESLKGKGDAIMIQNDEMINYQALLVKGGSR